MKKIVFLSLLVIVCILFTVQIKRGFFSALILVDIVRPPEKALMGKFIKGPTVKKVSIANGGRVISADLYTPKGKDRSFPLLLVHGANPAGKNDRRLVLLASDLARVGFLVLVPDLEGLKTFRIRLADAEDILQSFHYLSSRQPAPHRDGGMIGMSFGAGPMLLAAADSRIRNRVSVIATFGAYHELRNIMNFGLTGFYEYGGHHGLTRPDTSVRWMLAYRNLDMLRSPDDRSLLKKMIEKRNRYEIADADTIAKSLHAEGKAAYAFLLNQDPERFPPLYENLPQPVRDYAYQLSPSRAIKYINAYCIFAHATDDYSVPYTESLRLGDALGNPRRMHLALLPLFMGNESAEPSAGDLVKRYILGGWRMFWATYLLLEKSEEAAF
jgi:dienelactone hydrolase